jgi:hypothetical protein
MLMSRPSPESAIIEERGDLRKRIEERRCGVLFCANKAEICTAMASGLTGVLFGERFVMKEKSAQQR